MVLEYKYSLSPLFQNLIQSKLKQTEGEQPAIYYKSLFFQKVTHKIVWIWKKY